MAKEKRARYIFPQHAKVVEIETIARFMIWAMERDHLLLNPPLAVPAHIIRDYVNLDHAAFEHEEAEIVQILEQASTAIAEDEPAVFREDRQRWAASEGNLFSSNSHGGKARAIAAAAMEVASVAVDSGGGHAHMVQRDADGTPVFLILFCDRTSVALQSLIDAVDSKINELLNATSPGELSDDEENHLG